MTGQTFILVEKRAMADRICRERQIRAHDPGVHVFTNETAKQLRGFTISDEDLLIVEGVLSPEMMTNYGRCDARGSL